MTRLFYTVAIVVCLALPPRIAAAADLSAAPSSPSLWGGPWIGVYGAGVAADPNGGFSISSASMAAFPPVIPAIDAAGSGAISMRGAAVGLEAGWNLNAGSNFIIGVEGDLGLYGLRGKRAVGGTVPVFDIPFSINQSMRVDWESALRLRAGYALSEPALAYVEAGPAFANVRYASSYWDAADETENVSIQSVKLGFSLGAGVEYALTRNLSLKAEYVFTRFPSVTGAGAAVLTDGTTAVVTHSSGAIDQNAFRVGLSYYLQ